MDDLTATRLCAEAMGLPIVTEHSWERFAKNADRCWIHKDKCRDGSVYEYDPLHDDAQAMALVKKMQLNICATLDALSRIVRTAPADGWSVEYSPLGCVHRTHDYNLNRAIVYCVAAMQQSTQTTATNE